MTSVCFVPENVSEHLMDVPRKRASQRHRTVQVNKSSPEDLQAFFFLFFPLRKNCSCLHFNSVPSRLPTSPFTAVRNQA